jgi:phospholipid/cholesterol/gamma-HCH transport system substrate-binding protein
MKSFRDANKRVVAVVFLSLLGLGTAFAYLVGQQHLFSGGYEVSAVFSDTGGLTTGQDVRVAGVRSGRVTGIHPDFQHGRVIVTMSVDGGIHLGRDTHADVELSTLLGGRYVKLSGAVGRPYLDQLPAGQRRIPIERTTVPFTVTDALQNATKLTQTIEPKTINKLLDETAKIKTPTQEKLRQMLANFNTLAGLLNDDAPQIKDLIARSKQLTGTLAAKDDKLRQIIDSSQTLLDALVARRGELSRTLGQGSTLVRTLTGTIDRNQKELDNLLSSLHLLTTRLSVNMDALNTDLSLLGPTFTLVGGVKSPNPHDHWVEGLLTGLGPLQPPGPVSSKINGSGG